ncbi:MAG: hypothetical protein AAB353_05700 [Candidatus Hydrogenedentota bacterium]
MKKTVLFVGVMVLGAGIALASSLTVPFFLDRAPSDGSFPPSSLEASYIALHNNTASSIVVTVDYYDAGQNGTVDHQTPVPNTFLLPANATYGFRPVGNDPTTEVNGVIIPNMPGGEQAGTATLTWASTNPADIQGRLLQIGPGTTASMYLLPPGQ